MYINDLAQVQTVDTRLSFLTKLRYEASFVHALFLVHFVMSKFNEQMKLSSSCSF